MKIAKYRTIRGAQNYATELAARFPKRQFVVQAHPHDFAYTVRVMNDGQPVAYAGARKRAQPSPSAQLLAQYKRDLAKRGQALRLVTSVGGGSPALMSSQK